MIGFQKFKLQPKLMLFLLLLSLCTGVYSIGVSLRNLEIFFNSTYDINHDGKASLQQFVKYFQVMEPQADITQQDVIQTFQLFDANNDNHVTLKQLLQAAQISINYEKGHKQIHIGFTEKQDEMQIMWVSNPESYKMPIVKYGLYPSNLNMTAYAITKTYNVGHEGFHGTIYKAVLVGLQPNKRYYYIVGDKLSFTFSQMKFFRSRPKNQNIDEINLAIFGDMGTFAPFGHVVIRQIARDNFAKPYDFVFLTGDIAYAGIGSEQQGEIQPIWDLFGQLTQSFAAYTPFMPGNGNHQKYYNFTAYTARYELPRIYSQQKNFWFSVDYGCLHITYFSSQHSFTEGSQQYAFIENDLRRARQNPNIKWLILGTHRPFYSTNKRQYSNESDLVRKLQELVNKYKVDIVQTGHIHSYERSWPIYKGKAYKQSQNETHFVNPKHPIYVVQATAGALQYERWIQPAPEYSIKRMNKYGYGRIQIKEKGKRLQYQFIHAPSGRILDQWSIIKQ